MIARYGLLTVLQRNKPREALQTVFSKPVALISRSRSQKWMVGDDRSFKRRWHRHTNQTVVLLLMTMTMTISGLDLNKNIFFGIQKRIFPLGFPRDQTPQGQFYCSVGAKNAFGREMIEEHLDQCLEAGINVEGINAEVASGQWEYQCFAQGAKLAGDEMWISRYLLERLGEKYGLAIDWHPKPLGDTDWNGSGMHANFSNEVLRTCGSQETYEKICEAFRPVVKEHIEVYGAYNDQRLTGKHETQSIDEFSFGISDRGASIRIPILTVEKGWKGWLEDRRPASNGDPYKIASRIIKTVKSAKI